jgi:hypothetical protein
MRVALLVYGLFLLAGELVGNRLALIGWGRVTGLDVASAVADASLAVAVVLAVLLSVKLAVRRCRRWLRRRARSQLVASLRPAPPISVRSSREPARDETPPQDQTPTQVRAWPAFLSGYRFVTGP